MKNIWIITKTNIKRNLFAIILSLVGAIALCLLLSSMGTLVADSKTAQVTVGLLDYDHSALSMDFKRYMTKELDYRLLEDFTYDELSTQLIDRDISIIIEIPEHFYDVTLAGNKAEVTVTSLEDYENSAFVKAYINSYLGSIAVLSSGAGGNAEAFDGLLNTYQDEKVSLTKTSAAKVDLEKIKGQNGFINSIGFFLMFIFTISILVSFMVADDHLSGVFNRVQVTPVKPIQYVIGTGIFGIILCVIEVGIYSAYIYFKDIKTGIPIDVIVLMMLLYSFFTVCFSMLVALATKSKNAIMSIIVGFSTVGCILGGAYFPLDMAPKSLQNMARILPQYWFMDVFRRIQENSLANIYPNIIILTLFVLLSFLIGAVLFSQNYKKN